MDCMDQDSQPVTLKEARMNYRTYEMGGRVNMVTMERKFIQKYKQLTHLWNTNHPDYNNKLKRNAGYDAIMPIFRQYMPGATRFHIRQKINILRSVYKKERRKVLASSNIDSEGNVVYTYVPRSWKYNAMRFLDDDDADNGIEVSEVECPEYEDEQELEYVEAAETESGNETSNDLDTSKIDVAPIYLEEEQLEDDEDHKPFKRKRETDIYGSYTDHSVSLIEEDDILEKEFNAIGANVACKLQRMSLQQRYRAELLINKVLIKGLKERLTDSTDLAEKWQNQFEDTLDCIDASEKED